MRRTSANPSLLHRCQLLLHPTALHLRQQPKGRLRAPSHLLRPSFPLSRSLGPSHASTFACLFLPPPPPPFIPPFPPTFTPSQLAPHPSSSCPFPPPHSPPNPHPAGPRSARRELDIFEQERSAGPPGARNGAGASLPPSLLLNPPPQLPASLISPHACRSPLPPPPSPPSPTPPVPPPPPSLSPPT